MNKASEQGTAFTDCIAARAIDFRARFDLLHIDAGKKISNLNNISVKCHPTFVFILFVFIYPSFVFNVQYFTAILLMCNFSILFIHDIELFTTWTSAFSSFQHSRINTLQFSSSEFPHCLQLFDSDLSQLISICLRRFGSC